MQNWPLAISTARGEELMVVFVTICTPIPLQEACVAELRFTHHTHEVFGVPHLTQCCDHLPRNNSEKERKEYQEYVNQVHVCE